MNRKTFILLAIISFVVLMLCSCSDTYESDYDTYTSRIEELIDLGYEPIGGTEDVKAYLLANLRKPFGSGTGTSTSSGNNFHGLVPDPYNDNTTSTASKNNRASSSLIDDPYANSNSNVAIANPNINELISSTNNGPFAIPPEDINSIFFPTKYTIDYIFSEIIEATLLKHRNGYYAFVIFFNSDDAASDLSNHCDLPSTCPWFTYKPWGGSRPTLVYGPVFVPAF